MQYVNDRTIFTSFIDNFDEYGEICTSESSAIKRGVDYLSNGDIFEVRKCKSNGIAWYCLKDKKGKSIHSGDIFEGKEEYNELGDYTVLARIKVGDIND